MSTNHGYPPRSLRQRKHDIDRSKATYDLTPELMQRVLQVSNDIKCSQSDVVMHLLVVGLKAYQHGHLDLKSIRRPHRWSLRFEFKLPTPQLHFETPDIANSRESEGDQ